MKENFQFIFTLIDMKLNIFFFIGILVNIESCIMDSFDDRLKIINNSNQPIKYMWEMQSPSDSTIMNELKYMIEPSGSILSGDSNSYKITNTTYEQIIKSEPNKVFRVYIFNSDTIEKYTWEEVKKKNMILKRYDLTLEELKKKKWKIVYQ